MRLLNNWKTINDEVYQRLVVYELLDYEPEHPFGLKWFLESDMGEFVKSRAKEIEKIQTPNFTSLSLHLAVCCYMKPKDITYLTLRYL